MMEFENEDQYKAAQAEAEQREAINRAEQERKQAEQEAYDRVIQNANAGINNANDELAQQQAAAQKAAEDAAADDARQAASAAQMQQPQEQPQSTPFFPTLGSASMSDQDLNNTPQTGAMDDVQPVQFTPQNMAPTTPTPQNMEPFANAETLGSTSYDPATSPDFLKRAMQPVADTLGSMSYDPANASDAMRQAVANADRNHFNMMGGGNNGNGGNGGDLGATTDGTGNSSNEANEPRYYMSDEMLRAKHVPQPFWISKWRKEAWDESMAGFNKANDPADMAEQLIFGMINLGPKMYLAYLMHKQEQEVAIKNAAQTDREEYDKQLLLMKNMSPIEFNKNKANWVYCSEELHKRLKQSIPGVAVDENGYVDWTNCNEHQQQQIKEQTIEFVKDPNSPYKDLVEKFTRREFSEDELGREGIGLAALAEHYLKPNVVKNLKQSGNDGAALAPQPPQPPRSPNTPQNSNSENDTSGLNKVLAQAQKGKLKNVQPYDVASLVAAVNASNAEMRNLTQALRANLANGALIDQARAGRQAPQYGAQLNMQNPYDRGGNAVA